MAWGKESPSWPAPVAASWKFEKGTNRRCVRRLDGINLCVPGRCFYLAELGLLGRGAALTYAVCELADGEELRDACRRLLAGGWHASAAELLAVARLLAESEPAVLS